MALQVYDVPATALIKDIRSPVMVAHHFTVAFLCSMVLYPHLIPFRVDGREQDAWANYYSIYFLGVCEISTIPLIVYDLIKRLKATKAKYHWLQSVNEVVKPMFAISFLIFRVFYWPFVVVGFWTDLFNMWDEAHNYLVFLAYLAGSAFLTCLQVHWGFLIIRALYGVITGKGDPDEEDKAAASDVETGAIKEHKPLLQNR